MGRLQRAPCWRGERRQSARCLSWRRVCGSRPVCVQWWGLCLPGSHMREASAAHKSKEQTFVASQPLLLWLLMLAAPSSALISKLTSACLAAGPCLCRRR